MSVSRTAVRLIATCVASGALVAAAAMPALAAGGDHDRDNGRDYSHSRWSGHDHDGRFGDRDGGRHWGWHHDRGWHSGWHRHHGWYGEHWGHDRYPGRR
ncbi:hypothetical protein ABZ636_13295 [Streptomyces sp. NPDC007251]|uniref:hypothetical protein n=1 Tax=Streptomyces sp. NPDC007251 TaxID=3154483 RepID=UPI0033F96FA9